MANDRLSFSAFVLFSIGETSLINELYVLYLTDLYECFWFLNWNRKLRSQYRTLRNIPHCIFDVSPRNVLIDRDSQSITDSLRIADSSKWKHGGQFWSDMVRVDVCLRKRPDFFACNCSVVLSSQDLDCDLKSVENYSEHYGNNNSTSECISTIQVEQLTHWCFLN